MTNTYGVDVMIFNKKRKFKHEHQTFLPEWQEDSAFTEKTSKCFSSTAMPHYWTMRKDIIMAQITEFVLISSQLPLG